MATVRTVLDSMGPLWPDPVTRLSSDVQFAPVWAAQFAPVGLPPHLPFPKTFWHKSKLVNFRHPLQSVGSGCRCMAHSQAYLDLRLAELFSRGQHGLAEKFAAEAHEPRMHPHNSVLR